ncbi:MAG: gamma-glutamyltransferase family protein [Thermoleophilia bacterium]|nr:gamma-glutamyltransferase family protein [Thermoleophilia bacterium]
MFTTRPELRGTFGMVASTHWLASAAGMAVLERGGNAFDAAVAAGLTLQVVEPHLNGPAGEVPIVLYDAARDEVLVVCGQGTAPAAATVERFREHGVELVPGTGLLAACVPGAFDAWMLLLRDFGTFAVRDVLEFATGYAERGYPLLPRIADTIARLEAVFRAEWPSSAEIYLPVPEAGRLFRNRDLAATYRRVLAEADAGGAAREAQIERARDAWYRGFVAEAVDAFCAAAGGLLRGDDLAGWEATVEPPVSLEYAGHTVFKPGPWSQGPVFLQQLVLLAGFDLAELRPGEYVHTVVECAKLAFADRDALYADPAFVDVPLERLLSSEYAGERRALVGEEASGDLRPGLGGRLPKLDTPSDSLVLAALGGGEPTRGDTCHVDVADRHGNLVSATPSGGWLQSSPVVPGLGFPLGTRAQMFSLDETHPTRLEPGKRPRTTLSPSLAFRGGDPYLAFGTPGGDQQDQWSLTVFLEHVHLGRDLQAAIDAPAFHTNHLISSFHPRTFEPRVVELERRFGPDLVERLRERGHDVRVVGDWALGRVSAAGRENGVLKAGANPRGMQGYAVGR